MWPRGTSGDIPERMSWPKSLHGLRAGLQGVGEEGISAQSREVFEAAMNQAATATPRLCSLDCART
jgi:hypothetical protein